MAETNWNGMGNWTNASHWSGGVPHSSRTAEIRTGTSTLSTAGNAQTLTIDAGATLDLSNNASLTLLGFLSNAGTLTLGSGDTVRSTNGGPLTNSGTVTIGKSSTAFFYGLGNTGTITVQGGATFGHQATLEIANGRVSTSPIVSGTLNVFGNADVQLPDGIGFTEVDSSGTLQVYGSEARISLGAGSTNSALTELHTNAGTIDFEGATAAGRGGTEWRTTGGFTNTHGAELDIDALGSAGGSSVTFGGELDNAGSVFIGNAHLSSPTTVTAQSLNNSGSILIRGSGAELVIHGDATTSGALTIGNGSEVDVTGGSHSFTQHGAGSVTTVNGLLAASTINADGGLLDFKSQITSGHGVGNFNIGSAGKLEFDAGVDNSHTVDYQATSGTLLFGSASAAKAFDANIAGFGHQDIIDLLGLSITSLSYLENSANTGGVLSVHTNAGTILLDFKGDYATSNFTFGGSEIHHVGVDPHPHLVI